MQSTVTHREVAGATSGCERLPLTMSSAHVTWVPHLVPSGGCRKRPATMHRLDRALRG